MKKSVFAVCLLLASVAIQAETIKMRTGELISGSILSQTEYTLNLATSYGNITLNQREIEQILPDKHRLILKGGSQLVGVILDLDEFNLKLQTDDGTVVNVDMPQIVSIEVYDYDQGKKAQQEFVQQNQAQQQAAQAAQQQAAQTGAAPKVQAAGGLTFDSDINQVFGAQNATIVNGEVVTPSAAVEQPAPRLLSDEEAFIKGVKTGEISQQEYAAAAKAELASKKPAAQEPAKKMVSQEKNFNKYFTVEAGAMALDLQAGGTLKLGDLASVNMGDQTLDVGGTSVVISSKFLWRLKESNLWLGPMLGFASIANNDYHFDLSPQDSVSASSSGNILTFGAAANYYLNPASRFSFYLTANAAYEILTLNYRGDLTTPDTQGKPQNLPFRDTLSSSGFSGSVGAGVETWVDDVMIGLEVRQVFAPRSDELKESAASNTVFQAKLSWKF